MMQNPLLNTEIISTLPLLSMTFETAPISTHPCAPPELPPNLQFEQGKDYVIPDNVQPPFELLSTLGFGQSGSVEKVRDKHTGKVYARKTIWIRGRRMREETERTFFNEINIIRSLDRHHHIITIFATYMAKRKICLVLEPVADGGDLEQFLETLSDDHSGARLNCAMPVLERAFGCLASALAFMHRKRIRHKDIKPQNILVHQGSMIYTDFGYSLDCNVLQRSTTEGRPNALTRRYSAPEVLDCDRRNSLSDVFSLGCVFIEILGKVLKCPDLCPQKESFAANLGQIHGKLKQQNWPEKLSFLEGIIMAMTSFNPTDRLRSSQLAETILQVPGFCCVECLREHDVLAAGKYKRLEQMTMTINHEATRNTSAMIPSQHQNFRGWIWSETHHSYYQITYDNVGCPIYQWAPTFDSNIGYRVRTSREAQAFFVVGRVFAMLWSQPIDDTVAAFNNDDYSRVRFGGTFHTLIRRFIVVDVKKDLVHACVITAYSGLGTLKIGCVPSEHAIVHFTETSPTAIRGEYESGMTKDPIEIVPANSLPPPTMKPESRVRFSKTASIEMNVKVKDIGRVCHNHIPKLLQYWREESS